VRRRPSLPRIVLALSLTVFASTADAQAATSVPVITARSFTGGSAKVKVTGAFQVDGDVAINTKASFGDGEKTWIQFGASGSAEPNALMTYGDGEIGITVGKAKNIVTAEAGQCKGKTEVTATSVSGQ
jgi:hypothetical protein